MKQVMTQEERKLYNDYYYDYCMCFERSSFNRPFADPFNESLSDFVNGLLSEEKLLERFRKTGFVYWDDGLDKSDKFVKKSTLLDKVKSKIANVLTKVKSNHK